MDITTIAVLVVTGLCGGAINVMAGGATLLTFPIMLALGLPPIVANASSAVALVPGHILGVLTQIKHLPGHEAKYLPTIILMLVGGIAGAYLLSVTSDRMFELVIPLLIGIATLVFAFGKKAQSWLQLEPHQQARSRMLWLVPTAIYIGYFGAGAGVIIMALFSVTTNWPIKSANAFKNLIAALSNWIAIAVFAVQDIIAWPEALTMLAGAIAGGLIGGKLLNRMEATMLSRIIITAGAVLTVVYAIKYWT